MSSSRYRHQARGSQAIMSWCSLSLHLLNGAAPDYGQIEMMPYVYLTSWYIKIKNLKFFAERMIASFGENVALQISRLNASLWRWQSCRKRLWSVIMYIPINIAESSRRREYNISSTYHFYYIMLFAMEVKYFMRCKNFSSVVIHGRMPRGATMRNNMTIYSEHVKQTPLKPLVW